MKKIFTKLMLLAVAAAALVSCENKIDESTPVVELTQTVTLSAEKPTEVRTELIEGVPYWSKGDQIGVYVVDGESYKNYAFKNDNEEATLTTSFTGETAVVNTLYVYYPYVAGDSAINSDGVVKANLPSTQQPTVASFDGAADLMIAKPVQLDAEGKQLNNLEFARVGAIVKIVLKDKSGKLADQHVSSLTMTAANGLAGKVYLDVINQELGKLYDDTSRSTSVTANYTTATHFAVNGSNAVYLVVYPQTLASGSKLSFEAVTEGYKIAKEITLSQDIELAMSKVTTLNVSLEAANLEEIETIKWENNAYNLVPNNTGLEVGDKVVIAAAESDMAMGAQRSSNRGAVAITKNTNNTIDFDSNVAVLTVEAGKIEGTFAFKSSNGYLYASSSSDNQLKSEATLSENSSFVVVITDGVASMVASGSNTRNVIQYNSSSSLFSCYGSASQKPVSIYKLVGEYVIKAPAITLSIADVTVEHDATSGEAIVTATNGDGWAIAAATEATWVKNLNYADGKITFTTEANDGEARSATVNVTATKADYDNVTATFTISQDAKPAEGGPTTVVDVLNYAFTGITQTSGYQAWSGKTGTSGAVYAGQSCALNSAAKYIQLRNTSPSGIITTKSGGKVRKVVVTWSTSQNTTTGRQITIYGKNTAYSATTDVYDSNKRGTSLGTIKKGTNTELTINGDYEYIGILANGALYMDKIEITWETGEGGGSTPEPEPATPVWGTVTAPAEVAAAGGSASISYSVTNAVEGKFASATTTATWITDFTYTADKVTFNVAANTGAAREATVTLSYEGITESKTVTVSQAAGNTGGGDETKYYVKVTSAPSDWSGTYLIVWGTEAHATVSGKDLAKTADVVIANDAIASSATVDAAAVTIANTTGSNYSLKLPNGQYLSLNANDNKVAAATSAFNLTFEYTTSGVKIMGKDTAGNTRYVLKNGTYYRAYKSVGSYVLPTLYKLAE